ncbi:MAG TPA: ABC transporter ATP-binding protein [Crocinitomicaceae bacterium]|nr:ABC transporter ATP-binding protein [Crocinitomicaceae bacterium]
MKSLSYLNKYLFKYKWRLLLGAIFIIGSNWFKVEMTNYFGDLTDDLTGWETNGDPTLLLYKALKAGGYFMLLSLFSGFLLFMTRQTIIVVSRLIEYDLKNEIYRQYQRLSFSFYKRNNTGDLMNRISEDVTKVRMYLGPGIMYTINLTSISILVIKNMLDVSPYLTGFVLIPLPLMSYIIYKVSSRINKISTLVQEEQSHMSTLVQETFTGIRVIKAYGRTQEIEDKFNASSENYKTKNMKLVLVNSLFMPTIFILIGVSTILSIYLGGLLHYNDQISLGDILKFIFYVNMLTWPFASIGFVTSMIQRAAASQTRINEFLKEEEEITNTNTTPFSFSGKIEFRNVSYTYPNSGINAIKNLSFKIEHGESLGIVGKTGSGKSTILNLLMRHIEADSGEILIDDIHIQDINLDDYRNQTGVVPQDVFLFSDTIRNNIQFGCMDDSIAEKQLIAAAKEAYIHHNIIEFKDGYGTLLGERGVNLSGGQKQRVSIARALIRNPKLLLLDDCLSAVDTETEEIILTNLAKKKITSLVISHRISSIRNANIVLNLENGAVIEQGTHKELMNANGSYSELYKKQLTEKED